MNPHLIRDFASLKRSVAELAGQVESQIERSMQSFANRDVKLAHEVIAGDRAIDQREVEIEEEALKTLSLYQPMASDLRFLIAVLKVNSELERAADYGQNIAERAITFATNQTIGLPAALEDMSKRAQSMLRKSLDSLLNLDSLLAKEVRVEDDIVDELNREVFEWMKKQIKIHPDWIDPLLSVGAAAKMLERVGDIATNIAEDTIYLVEGYIARHKRPEISRHS